MWNLRNDTNELTKQKETHRLENEQFPAGVEGERGRGEEGIVRELGMTCTHGCN